MNRQRKLNSAFTLFTVVFLFFTSLPTTQAQRQRPTRANGARATNIPVRPKLVLAIVIDQFRYDFLERFADVFGDGGFRRLISEGAFFTNANYDYVPTFTACGHAAV